MYILFASMYYFKIINLSKSNYTKETTFSRIRNFLNEKISGMSAYMRPTTPLAGRVSRY
jgi:hypothetical protein